MHAFLLTKPVYLARELAKLFNENYEFEWDKIKSDPAEWFYNYKVYFLIEAAATLTTQVYKIFY